MNLRGSVIPIYDLAASFALPPTVESPRNVVVVAVHEKQTIGLLVEAVSEILSVDQSSIQEAPDIRSENARRTITGVITVDDGMTRVIDLAAMLHGARKPAP